LHTVFTIVKGVSIRFFLAMAARLYN